MLAHDEPQKRTISLVATGAIKTAPDTVDISTGVTSEAPSAREALDKNTDAMTKVVEALKAEVLSYLIRTAPRPTASTRSAMAARPHGPDETYPFGLAGCH